MACLLLELKTIIAPANFGILVIYSTVLHIFPSSLVMGNPW